MNRKKKAFLGGWRLKEGRLSKTFVFDDFNAALAFINWVGDFSETIQHHPKIINTYNQVVLEIWTQDTNSLTSKDEEWIDAFEKKGIP